MIVYIYSFMHAVFPLHLLKNAKLNWNFVQQGNFDRKLYFFSNFALTKGSTKFFIMFLAVLQIYCCHRDIKNKNSSESCLFSMISNQDLKLSKWQDRRFLKHNTRWFDSNALSWNCQLAEFLPNRHRWARFFFKRGEDLNFWI